MEMKRHELIEEALCKDLDDYETKIKQGQKMSPQDYAAIHDIYSALAKRETYLAMKDAAGYSEDGVSGRRGRGADGRYVSRESYDEGYDRGYSEAMSRNHGDNYSTHYPMPYYPGRW